MKRPLVLAAVISAEVGLGLGALAHYEHEPPAFETSAAEPIRIDLPTQRFPVYKPAQPAPAVVLGEAVTLDAESSEVINSQIVPSLGQVGLEFVEDEYKVNKPNEFLVKANEKCGGLFGVDKSQANPSLKNIGIRVFGRLSLLKRYTKVKGLPEFDNRLAHTEGSLNEGHDFDPKNKESVAEAIKYVGQTTLEVCKGQGLLDN